MPDSEAHPPDSNQVIYLLQMFFNLNKTLSMESFPNTEPIIT